MSPPDTSVETQRRRHAGPLIGLAVLLALVLLGFLWWAGQAFLGGDDPREDAPNVRPLQE